MTVPRLVITRSFFVIMRQFKLVFTWSFLVIMRKLTLNYKTNDLCSMTLFVFRNKNKQKPTYICKNFSKPHSNGGLFSEYNFSLIKLKGFWPFFRNKREKRKFLVEVNVFLFVSYLRWRYMIKLFESAD